jgi:hypothetical protein
MDIQRGRGGRWGTGWLPESSEVAGVLVSSVLQDMARDWWGFMEGCGSRQEMPWRGGEKRGRERLSEKKRRFRTWVPHEVRVARKSWFGA